MLTKKSEILKSVGLIASLSGAVTLWSVGAFAQGGPPIVPPVGGGGGTVECPADSLQDAIDGTDSGGTVLFEGTCTEDIVIQTDGLTLDGNPDGDNLFNGTIVGTVKVVGAQRVTLQNFDVDDLGTNGGGFEVGIEAVDGAAASVNNVAVSLTEDFAIGFYANLGSLLKVQDSAATLVVSASECDSGAFVSNANSLALSNGGNTFTVDDDTAICASNDSDYRQSSGTNDIVSSPRPAVSFDDSLVDIRGVNVVSGAGLVTVGRSSVLRVRASNLSGSNVRLRKLSTCEIRNDGSLASVGNIIIETGSICP